MLHLGVSTQLPADTVHLCEFVFVRKLTEFCWAYGRKERRGWGVECFNSSWIFSACLVYFSSSLGRCCLRGSEFKPIIGLCCICLQFSCTYSKVAARLGRSYYIHSPKSEKYYEAGERSVRSALWCRSGTRGTIINLRHKNGSCIQYFPETFSAIRCLIDVEGRKIRNL